MSRYLLAAVAATLTLAAPALANERTFTHEGVTYTYTSVQQGEARVLEGSASEGGDFRLTVKNGWVRGKVGGTRVSFQTPKTEA
ncbi:MAG: hypothetical protein EOP62_08785 [Sphingomonadales bacterium]|nr:MAG: hypothetical protein EOP62_08785 [Sphingomonadales bacterium]